VSTSKKAIISLLITIVLFTAFVIFAFSGLFGFLETRFYNPSITAHMINENKRNAIVIEKLFTTLQNRFSETLGTDAVRRSFISEKTQEDFSALSTIFSLFINSVEGLQWVRFIDSGGIKLHFSTYSPDIIVNNYETPFYLNYNEPDLPYDLIAVQNGEAPKYTFDNKSKRILFSFPLYDSFDIYWGTALFSLSLDSVLDRLFIEGRMIASQELMLIPNPQGMVFGMSTADEGVLPSQISSAWKANGLKTVRLASSDSDTHFILTSAKTSQNFFIGSLVNEDMFQFPQNIKLILLVSFFLTIYLTIFLLFSLKQEPLAIIQNRLKHLQVSLLEQFYESKDEEDWSRWIREMDYRREEISALLKKGIRPASDNLKKEIDILINKSWDEFLSLLGSRSEPGFDEEKLRSAINSMLAALPKTGKGLLSGGEASPIKTGLLKRASAIVKELEETDLVEELEELDEADEHEDLESKEIATGRPTPELPAASHAPSKADIDALASQIEFSPEPEPETNGGDSIENDLEIVSPFSAMLGGFTNTIDYDDPGQGVETTKNRGNVIKEKEGLPFVSADALNPDEKESKLINQDFKNLVDSVIKD